MEFNIREHILGRFKRPRSFGKIDRIVVFVIRNMRTLKREKTIELLLVGRREPKSFINIERL